MANSWNGPQLGSPIRTDVPELQKKLIALLKQDPTSVANIPSGAKRLVNTSGTQWQVQQYNGSSWAAIGKLMHDVDKLDGYHAAITPAASTIAVRNADKKLEGDITGNAATASSAATLSQTLPVNKGGTGATTSEAARSNLGVPPTSHTSTATTYGVGNATQYGHLKLSDAANSSSGVTGGVAATPAAVKAAKDAADAAQSSADNAQNSADAAMDKASTLATASAPGIVKPGTGMTVDAAGGLNVSLNNTVTSTSTTQAATANAAKVAYDKGVKALDAAAAAKNAADTAQSTADNAISAANRTPKKLGQRTTTGAMTITGATPGKFLVLGVLRPSDTKDNAYIKFHIHSGTYFSYPGTSTSTSLSITLGKPQGDGTYSTTYIDIIKDKKISIQIVACVNVTLEAWEV